MLYSCPPFDRRGRRRSDGQTSDDEASPGVAKRQGRDQSGATEEEGLPESLSYELRADLRPRSRRHELQAKNLRQPMRARDAQL